MRHENWTCPKCGGVSKFFNVQTEAFTSLTCKACTYTEMYKTDTSTLSNVLDFFGN